MNYQTWLNQATLKLQAKGDSEAKLDAFCLLSFVTQKNRASLLAFGETLLTAAQIQRLESLLARRLTGEPLAYILGEREFWSLNLAVSPATLIPRPDTEILVEQALVKAQHFLDKNSSLRILDLGTGTGAIALALGCELTPQCRKCGVNLDIIGVDFQPQAVALAQQNAERNGIQNVQFLQSDWFSNLSGEFDIIVSNPPYIDAADPHLAQGDVRFEPNSALVAADNGLADLNHIIQTTPNYLRQNGWLFLEHGFEQRTAVQTIFKQNQWKNIQTVKDYGGNDRVTFAQFSLA